MGAIFLVNACLVSFDRFGLGKRSRLGGYFYATLFVVGRRSGRIPPA